MIALVDCNSFYWSVETVFNPQLRGQPGVVLSNNDGCIVARSKAAKDIEIPMGAPFFKWSDFLEKNKVHVFSSNYALIHDFHRRVMTLLKSYDANTQVYSIDEAFLDLGNLEKKRMLQLAQDIRQQALKGIGIPLSIGIGRTKTLAKLANSLAKKCGSGILYMESLKEETAALDSVPVGEVWGIGRRKEAILHSLEIHTARQLRDFSNARLIQKKLSIVTRQTQDELRGQTCIDLHSIEEEKKNIISTRSFGKTIYDLESLTEAISCHVSRVAEKLRLQNSTCTSLYLFIRTSRHSPQYLQKSGRVQFFSGTSSTNRLIAAAIGKLKEIYQPHIGYKKCGVGISGFEKQGKKQLTLMESTDFSENEKLMETLDKINRIYGAETLKFASCGTSKHWKMLSERRSQVSTNKLSKLLLVQ